MCLMIWQPARARFNRDDIADFWAHNPDGMGIMWVSRGRVAVRKRLPRNAEDAWDFYRRHALGRNCAIHFRMCTHGAIDTANCHPYKVTHGIWLMHNGVLEVDTRSDPARSDTWHYVRAVLRPQLQLAPSLLYSPAWQQILAAHVGPGNRLLFLAPRGPVVVNRHLGVEYKGAWLSNSYAWSGGRLHKPTLAWPARDRADYWDAYS
jgi:hypothetical protein